MSCIITIIIISYSNNNYDTTCDEYKITVPPCLSNVVTSTRKCLLTEFPSLGIEYSRFVAFTISLKLRPESAEICH